MPVVNAWATRRDPLISGPAVCSKLLSSRVEALTEQSVPSISFTVIVSRAFQSVVEKDFVLRNPVPPANAATEVLFRHSR